MQQPPINRRVTSVALAACAGITAIAGVATGIAVPAGAAGGRGGDSASAAVVAPVVASPRFLTAAQLPVSNRFGAWSASAVKPGLPTPRKFCLTGMPSDGTRYETFRSVKSAFGEEYVTVAETPESADALVRQLRTAIQGCHKYWLNTVSKGVYKYGKITASWSRYATYDISDGLRIYGVFTVPPKKAADPMSHMFAIGREGASVMVLHLGVTGSKDKAPVNSFTTTAKRALRELY
jgi:hypothetical protein